MTTVSYQLNEGAPWHQGKIDLSVRQIVGRLNKIYAEKDSDGFPYAHHCDAFSDVFHAIRLPDGRIWDTCNGWRKKKE